GAPSEIVPPTEPLSASAWRESPSVTVKLPPVAADPPMRAVDWNRMSPPASTDPSTCGVESIVRVPPTNRSPAMRQLFVRYTLPATKTDPEICTSELQARSPALT